MKKFIACLTMIALLITCFSGMALAKQPNEGSKPSKVVDYTVDTPDVYGDTAKTAESQVSIKLLYNYNINMPVPIFGQRWSPWSTDLMKTLNYTIGSSGCALTSCTMVAKYYGKNTDPRVFNIAMGNDACPLNWYSVSSKGGSGYISGIDTIVSYPSLYQVLSYARTALEQNKPVILGYVKPSGNTHYVVIKAVYGQGTSLSDFGCNDPWTGAYSNLYDTIGSQPLYKIVIYNR